MRNYLMLHKLERFYKGFKLLGLSFMFITNCRLEKIDSMRDVSTLKVLDGQIGIKCPKSYANQDRKM